MEITKSKTREELLLNTVSFYNLGNRSARSLGGCEYISEDGGKRCAIGRELDEELCRVLEVDEGGAEVSAVYDRLPKRLLDMGLTFLSDIQNLHDSGYYWADRGISDEGLTQVKYIIEDYNLNINPQDVLLIKIKGNLDGK